MAPAQMVLAWATALLAWVLQLAESALLPAARLASRPAAGTFACLGPNQIVF